ncbi:hypothetical protein llap_1546 [Limosa lapponica baueri]|uniref:Uncharacterized protein n=1 Tax=Limosa lapponica baueri TaxID=1758121 RepID=A0A2I0UQ51_LIMLA|nr:hypothetical protein llap_1546 [Limosa lapponica baueri]
MTSCQVMLCGSSHSRSAGTFSKWIIFLTGTISFAFHPREMLVPGYSHYSPATLRAWWEKGPFTWASFSFKKRENQQTDDMPRTWIREDMVK